MSEVTDGQLVERVRERGDREAYSQLVRRYQGHAYGLAYSLLEDWSEAQDMAQEAFIRAYVNLHQLQKPDRFAAWLRRIVFGTCMDWLRTFRPNLYKAMGDRPPGDVDQLDNLPAKQSPPPPQYLLGGELSELIVAAIDQLPPKYRIPLTMFHLDGLSYQKVADFLDVPLGTAKSLLHRAREKLKPALASYAQEDLTAMVTDVFREHKLDGEFARRVIDGVPTLKWGTGRECTFAGALEAATAVTKHPCRYSDIMGYTALAFRTRWYRTDDGADWCSSSPCGEFDEEIEAATRATGWQLTTRMGRSESQPHMEQYASDYIAELNAGRPVLVYPPELNAAVAYGYEEGGKAFLLRDYMKGDEPHRLPVEKLGFMSILLREHHEPIPPTDALRHALDMADRNWDRKLHHHAPGWYHHGRPALTYWREDIAGAPDLTDRQQRKLFFVSWWCYCSLEDARKAAVRFLTDHADDLGATVGRHLRQAADIYREEANLLAGPFLLKNAFFGPWSGKAFEQWDDDARQREQEVLSAALALEEQANGALRDALQAARYS